MWSQQAVPVNTEDPQTYHKLKIPSFQIKRKLMGLVRSPSTQFPKATLLQPKVMCKLNYFVSKANFCGWRKSGGHSLWSACQPTQDSTGLHIPQRTDLSVKISDSKTAIPFGKACGGGGGRGGFRVLGKQVIDRALFLFTWQLTRNS